MNKKTNISPNPEKISQEELLRVRNIAKNSTIIIVGFRATGKTSIGKKVAEILNIAFVDIDKEITKQTGKTISQIVEKEGWTNFRLIEHKIFKKLVKQKGLVISTGGGTLVHNIADKKGKLIREHSTTLLKTIDNSLIFLLTTSEKEIIKRLQQDKKTTKDQRPTLDPQTKDIEVLRERKPLYEALTNNIINTSQTNIEDCALLIVETILNQ